MGDNFLGPRNCSVNDENAGPCINVFDDNEETPILEDSNSQHLKKQSKIDNIRDAM